jgi:hypothetical protein
MPSATCGGCGSGTSCLNINECTLGTHNCLANAVCIDTQGGFSCGCKKAGYSDSNDGSGCVDTNECSSKLHNCGPTQQCANTDGGFRCECGGMGFTLDAAKAACTCSKAAKGNSSAPPGSRRYSCMYQAQVCQRFYDTNCAFEIPGAVTYDIVDYGKSQCYELVDGTSLHYTSCDSSGVDASLYTTSDCTGRSNREESYRMDFCEEPDDDSTFMGQLYRSYKCKCMHYSPAAFTTVSASALSLVVALLLAA